MIAASVLAGVVILASTAAVMPGCKGKAPPPAVVKPVLPTTMPPLPARTDEQVGEANEPVKPPPMDLTFQCEKCRHQFSVPLEKMSDDPDAMAELEFSVRDCPSCGTKKSCWRTIQCPHPICKKHYISQTEKAHLEAMRQGRTGPEGIQDVCPHCGTNLLKWYREHRKR